jgi:putative ABC transport system ATP-binding protein
LGDAGVIVEERDAAAAAIPPAGAIRLRDVHKTYQLGDRRVAALRGVDLDVEGPGFHAIMGPSGSGKSTLLHLLAALDRPDRGSIEVSGERIDQLNETQLTVFRRRRLGIIFQQFNLVSTLTALDNVTLPGMLDGMTRDEREARGAALLKSLGLNDRMQHRPDALSGGEQQRVAIARALFFEPRVLVADEPTGNLDSRTSAQLFELLRDLAAQRRITMLMVTHEPTAAAHCQRVHLLRDGRIEDTFDVDGLDAIVRRL